MTAEGPPDSDYPQDTYPRAFETIEYESYACIFEPLVSQ